MSTKETGVADECSAEATGVPQAADDIDVRGDSQITILPDGRVYVYGLSPALLEILCAAGPWDTSFMSCVEGERGGGESHRTSCVDPDIPVQEGSE